jgi:hypothetical protein
VEVSKHIKKASKQVRLFGEVRDLVINGITHKALKAYTGEQKQYIVSVIRGHWRWSTCNCAGYMYTSICKHIYVANEYLDNLQDK